MMLDQRDAARIARYRPDMPSPTWEEIGPFVRAAVTECVRETPYGAADLMYAVSRHVWWCTDTAGFELDRETLFRRDVISASVEALVGVSLGAKGNRRSQLFRVGEVLQTIERQTPLPPFRAASPNAPYSTSDIIRLRGWAHGQPTDLGRANAWALLVLGLGAGLRAGEICSVRHTQVLDSVEGHTFVVAGDATRLVPLLSVWEADWHKLAKDHGEDGRLFRPGVRGRYPNMLTNFVHRSTGIGLKPQSQRLRSTWIVTQLTTGTPLRALMSAAGISSLSALSRFADFLPTQDDGGQPNRLRHPEMLSPVSAGPSSAK